MSALEWTILEWTAVAFGVASVWLTGRQNPWCWPLGIVSVSLFAVLFWRAELPNNAALQLVYVGLCAYGWWAWVKGGPTPGQLRVTRTPRRALALLALGGAALAVVLGATLGRSGDASLPFWDAGTTAYSLVAQWMQTKKWLESWALWIAVDVVYVGMFVATGLVPTAGQYALFLVLAVLGHREWKRSLLSAEGVSAEAVRA